jgi:hypothetical protein
MRVIRMFTAVAVLVLILGLHWTALQTIAWSRMVLVYSRTASMGEAIRMTFDGQHPCRLCLAVREGCQAESNDTPTPAKAYPRLECVLPDEGLVLVRLAGSPGPSSSGPVQGPTRAHSPPKPRPREHFAA